MADQKQIPNEDSISPLFNKMDALMARHRKPAGPQFEDIPVLTDIAPEAFDIPILTDVINEELIQKIENIERSLAQAQSAKARQKLADKLASENELAIPSLMFEPSALNKSVATSNSIAIEAKATNPTGNTPRFTEKSRSNPATPVAENPVFLDLPLLDLDAINTPPVIPSATAAPIQTEPKLKFVADDLVIDFTNAFTAEDAALSKELSIDEFIEDPHDEDSATETQLETIELRHDNKPTLANTLSDFDLEIDLSEVNLAEVASHHSDETSDPLDLNTVPEAEAEAEAEASTVFAPEMLAASPSSESATPSALYWEDDLATDLSLSSRDIEPRFEITLSEEDKIEGIEPAALLENECSDIPSEEVASSSAEASQPSPVSAPEYLNHDAVAELTAIVGAQLAVDIASEVEQLARQHFSKLMAQFYGDTLRELTSEMSGELEARLSPRITELVQQELISQGLIRKRD